jgi:nucleoside-diphosphate-sugar epimerase
VRVLVVGATGHIGSYLVPRLASAGHEVVAMSRQERRPYFDDPAWGTVEQVRVDRAQEDRDGTFALRMIQLRPDAIIDLLCYTRSSAGQLVDALRGQATYLLHCGTIWVHGPSGEVPTTEATPRRPLEEYGTEKAAIEQLLIEAARAGRVRATVLHPGHVVGPGWTPVTPAGNFTTEVFGKLARGEVVALPHFGLETLHHVHADDVAQAFVLALDRPSVAVGEAFHVVAPKALTMRGYAEAAASWFGRSANLAFLPWDDWRKTVDETEAYHTANHVHHSPCISIDKARTLLGYAPQYTSLQAIHESVAWLVADGQIDVGERQMVAVAD